MLTKGAIGNLVNRYKAVLKKCNLINTFGSLAVASMLVLGGAGVAEAVEGPAITIDTKNNTYTDNKVTISNQKYEDYTLSKQSGSSTDGAVIMTKYGSGLTVTIENSEFNNNSMTDNDVANGAYGGAINLTVDNVILKNVRMAGNEATANATNASKVQGAAYRQGSGTIDASNLTITGTTANGGSVQGAAMSLWAVSGTINNANFNNNIAISSGDIWSSEGGALYVSGAQWGGLPDRELTISNSTFSNNECQSKYYNYGGAIKITAGAGKSETENAYVKVILDNVTFDSNSVAGSSWDYGGAINSTNAVLDIKNSTFTKNHADHIGGAIYFKNSTGTKYDKMGTMTISNSAFKENTSGGDGGALFNNGCIVSINDATFIGNTASNKGGAIYNSGTLTLEGNNTFSGNTAAEGNDIYNVGTLTINGTTSLAGGIAGDNTGTIDGTGSIVITDATATISGQKSIAKTLTASATGDVNDALAGDIAQLEAQLNGVKVTSMEEGLIAGEVIKRGDKIIKKVNTVLKDTLDQATAAPLAVNRILMNDVRKRMGDLRDASGEAGVWMRWDGGKLKGDEGLTNNFNTIQIGGDMLTGIKNVRAGVAASFTHGDIDHNNGDGEMESYTFAAYGTWMADNGMFADVIGRVGFTNSEINAKGGKADLDNEALSLSAEYGWRLPVCDQFFVEPQVELTYTHVTGADFTIKTAQYDVDSVDSLIGRAGLAAGWKLPNDRGNIYARASVVHEFLGDSKISATNNGGYAAYELDGDDTWLEYGIGANVKLTDKTYIWADVERTEGADIDEEWRGTVGIRYSF